MYLPGYFLLEVTLRDFANIAKTDLNKCMPHQLEMLSITQRYSRALRFISPFQVSRLDPQVSHAE